MRLCGRARFCERTRKFSWKSDSKSLQDIVEKKDCYKKFYEQFGKFRKLSIHESSTNQAQIIELVQLSNSQSGDELNRWKEHVDRMVAVAE